MIHVYVYTYTQTRIHKQTHLNIYTDSSSAQQHVYVPGLLVYGVATISRLLNVIGLFCRIQSLL